MWAKRVNRYKMFKLGFYSMVSERIVDKKNLWTSFSGKSELELKMM